MSKNLTLRLLTAAVLVGITLPMIYLPIFVFRFFVLVATLIALFELFDVAKVQLNLKYVHFAIPTIFICILFVSSFVLQSYFLILLSIAFILLSLWFVCDKRIEFSQYTYLLFTLLYTGMSYNALTFIREVSANAILFLFLAVFLTDTGAYFVGKRYGKHKLAPELSPKKTIEGAIGGVIVGTASALLFLLLLSVMPFLQSNFKPTYALGISAVFLSLASEFGDLFASKIKRAFGKKDFGFIFPGHGGVIDRVDGLILATLVFYLILQII